MNLQAVFQDSHTALGAAGECWAREFFAGRGFEIRDCHTLGDMEIVDRQSGEILVIEVKTARRGVDRRRSKFYWRFNLRKAGHTDHRKSDRVLAIALSASGVPVPYLIPTSDVFGLSCLTISGNDPRDYGGKYAQYRVRGC